MKRLIYLFFFWLEPGIVAAAILGELYCFLFRKDLTSISTLYLAIKQPEITFSAIWSILVIGGFTLYSMYVNMAHIFYQKKDIIRYTPKKILLESYYEEVIYRIALCWIVQLGIYKWADELIPQSYGVASIIIGLAFVVVHNIDKTHWQTTIQHVLSLFMLSLAFSILIRDMGLVITGGLHFVMNVLAIILSRQILYYLWDRDLVKKGHWYFIQ